MLSMRELRSLAVDLPEPTKFTFTQRTRTDQLASYRDSREPIAAPFHWLISLGPVATVHLLRFGWVQTSPLAGVISSRPLGAIADSTPKWRQFCHVEVPTNDHTSSCRDHRWRSVYLRAHPSASLSLWTSAVDNLARFDIPRRLCLTPGPSIHSTFHLSPRRQRIMRSDAGDCGVCVAFRSTEPTVTHTPATPAGVVSVTVPLTGVSVFTNYIRWSDNQSLGSLFSADGGDQTLTTVDLNSGSPSGQVFISITGTNNRFTPAFEASGTIIFEASDGETLEVMIADADMSEPYMWVPLASVLEVVAFVNHIRTLTDQTGTLTLRGEGVAVTDHAVNAGDASWAFAVPEPTVTHVPVVTNDHTSTRGMQLSRSRFRSRASLTLWRLALSPTPLTPGTRPFAFAVTEPGVTYTPVVTADHAVNAGDLNWGFDVPRPTVTHTTVVTQAHAVNAGGLSWTFDLPQPRVTGGFTVSIGGMVTAYIGGAIQPIETASLQITRRVGERPIAECDLFFRNINTFRRPRRGSNLKFTSPLCRWHFLRRRTSRFSVLAARRY